MGILVAAASLALAAPGVASAYPLPRGADELEVAWTEPLLAVGGWAAEGDTLVHGPSGASRSYWITATPTGTFHRLRLERAGRAEITLLFRMSVRAPTGAARWRPITGYGVALSASQRSLSFVRWDRGGVQDPGVRVSLADIPDLAGRAERGALELLLWTGGPSFVAMLADAHTKTPLAHLAWSDASYPAGTVGLAATGRAGTAVRARLGVVSEVPSSDAAARAPPPAPAPLRREWLAVLSPHDLARAPAEVRAQLQILGANTEGVPVITTEVGVAALEGAGIRPLRVQPGVPYRLRPNRARELRDEAAIGEALRRLARRYPERTRLEELGHSTERRPLLALRIADNPDDLERPAVLLCAAHHANEASTPEFVLDAAQVLLEGRDRRAVQWLRSLAVVVVPMVNPDGSHAFWHIDDQLGRKNRRPDAEAGIGAGVDLNRNYPFRWGGTRGETRFDNAIPEADFYRGPHAGSEPEVQAMMDLAHRERFVASISYHASAARLLVPYTIPGVANPEPSVAWLIAEEMIAALPHGFPWGGGGTRRYQAARALYPVSGTEQDWYHHTFGTLAYLIEIPYRRARGDRLSQSILHSRPAWMTLLDRWVRGPSLSLRVEDEQGGPVAAVVRIEEIQTRADERWTTSPHTGWYHTYLPAPGVYTVRVQHEDTEVTRQVEVQEGVTRLRVSLAGASLVASRDDEEPSDTHE